MIIVQIKDERTNYILTAEIGASGDLVLSASDFSPSVKDMFSTDEYEYYYIVQAVDVGRVIAALGATRATLLDAIRDLLAKHGITASTEWKAWLDARNIPSELSVWR
jgi:hypothetical protein